MPVRITVVHNDQGFLDRLLDALAQADLGATAFTDPFEAWEAITEADRLDILITRIRFASGPYGIALARHARIRHPGIHVIFPVEPEMRRNARGIGSGQSVADGVAKVMEAVHEAITLSRDEVSGPQT